MNQEAVVKNESAWKKIHRIFLSKGVLSRRNANNVLAMGIIAFGYTFFEEIVTSYLQFFYTEFVLLPAATVSVVLSIGMVVDGVTDLFMGAIIDRFEFKKGRIRPWFLWMAIPTGISTIACFLCRTDWPTTTKIVYLFFIYNIYCTCMTTLRMPKTTMISLCFNEPESRQMANVVSGILSQISQLLITAGLPLLLATLGANAAAYTNSAIILSVGGIILTAITYLLTREVVGSKAAVENVRSTEGDAAAEETLRILKHEESVHAAEKKKMRSRSLLKDIGMLFGNKYWILVTCVGIANGCGIGFMFGVAAYFATYTLGGIAMLSAIFGTMSVGMAVGIILAAPMVVKIDSRQIGVIGSFLGALGMLIAAVGILSMNNLIVFHAGLFIRQLGTGMLMAIMGDVTARAIDFGEWKFGIRLDGLSFSGSSVMQKIMSALASAILGFVLTASGYAGGLSDIPATAHAAINTMFLWIPCIALVASGVFFLMIDLSNDRIRKIRDEISERAKVNK